MRSEQELRGAAEFREGIHAEALARVRAVLPGADRVIDRYAADEYFQKLWDYPGQWYNVAGVPPGAGSRKELVASIVRDTLEYFRREGRAFTADEFFRIISEYPDLACDYCVISAQDSLAAEPGVFPYRGADSHLAALERAARALFGDGACDLKLARRRKLSGRALFAPAGSDEWVNYRRAFLSAARGGSYTDADFERVNAVLFPCGEEGLEVYRWTAGWADYFGEEDGSRGGLCLTVYDGAVERFVVIMSPAGK
jgi:hypothetical protein